jgi:hypothetical protein
MKARRGAVSLGVALVATALVQVVLGGGCGEFGVASDGSDAAVTLADGATPITPDGAPTADSSAELDAGPSSPPDASCGSHSFCADFESATPSTGWSTKHTMAGALGIASGTGWPGNALNSSIAAQDAPPNYAYLAQELPGAQGIHLEVEMKVPATPLPPGAVITLVQFSGDTGSPKGSGVGFVLASTQQTPASVGFYVAYGDGTDQTFDEGFDLPRDQWLHVVFDLRFGLKSGYVKVTVGQRSAIDQALDTVVPALPQLRIGVQHYNGATPAFTVLYDTVRADPLQ